MVAQRRYGDLIGFGQLENGHARFCLILLPVLSVSLSAKEVIPYFNASLMGGQYFFGSQEGSLSGNARLVTSAAIKMSPYLTVLPLYKVNNITLNPKATAIKNSPGFGVPRGVVISFIAGISA